MNEYAIWGNAPETDDEQLLVTRLPNGQPIATRPQAMALVKMLEAKGCTKVRIQHVDDTAPVFTL